MAQISGAIDLTGPGARAEGLGGAFTGVADDATAIMWNPAGLTQLEKPEVSFVVRQVFLGLKYADDGIDNKLNHFAFNFVSAAYPLNFGNQKLTIAVAYQQLLDLYYIDRDYINNLGVGDQKGSIYTITPGIAYKVTSTLSLGASANIWTGSSKIRYQPSDFGWKDNWKGFNLQVGAMADLSGLEKGIPFKVGVTLKTPFKMDDKYNFTNAPDKYNWKWEFPTILSFGASYRIGEYLTIAADYEIEQFGKAKILNKDDNVKYDFSDSKKDLMPIRVGAEYLIVTSGAVIPIRAGFKTTPTLLADMNYDFLNDQYVFSKKQVTGTAFSVGSGLIYKMFAMDVAYTIGTFQRKFEGASTEKFSKGKLSFSTIFYF